MPIGSALHWLDFSGNFRKNTAFESYGVKSEQANMQISAGLPRQDVLAPHTLEAQEVSTEGVYRLPHAFYCQLFRRTMRDSVTPPPYKGDTPTYYVI